MEGRQSVAVRAPGQFDPVEAGHHDVGKEKIEHVALERFQRALAIGIVLHLVPGPAKCRRQEGAHGIVVFREEDLGHVCPGIFA